MTTPETDRRRGLDRRQSQSQTGLSGWLSEDVRVTRGWLLLCVAVTTWFVVLAMYGGFRVVDGLRRDDCQAANVRRIESQDVAMQDVAADRAIWLSIDNLLDGGIPEPARATIFVALDTREALIARTYAAQPCH